MRCVQLVEQVQGHCLKNDWCPLERNNMMDGDETAPKEVDGFRTLHIYEISDEHQNLELKFRQQFLGSSLLGSSPSPSRCTPATEASPHLDKIKLRARATPSPQLPPAP
jgi:hypothetical protein